MHVSIPIDFYLYIMLIDVIVGVILYRRIHPSVLKIFVPFLALSLAVELTGLITSRMNLHNQWMFNFFTCIEFLFYSYIYSRLLEKKWVKVIHYCMIAYPVLFLANVFFNQGVAHFHTITYLIGSVMVVFWCYLYFRQLMLSPHYTPVFRNPVFWISTGLLFFYTGFFFYMSAVDFLGWRDKTYWHIISGTLNTLLYGCFLIAFLCRLSLKKMSLR
jgi:hypothetical protein